MAAVHLRHPTLKRFPGGRIRVTEKIVGRAENWTCAAEGVVESCGAEPAGNWYAHGKNEKPWL